MCIIHTGSLLINKVISVVYIVYILIVRGTPVISHVPLLSPIFPVSFWCAPTLPDLSPEYCPETRKLQNAPEVVRSIQHSIRHPFKAHHCTAHSHAIFCVRVVSS